MGETQIEDEIAEGRVDHADLVQHYFERKKIAKCKVGMLNDKMIVKTLTNYILSFEFMYAYNYDKLIFYSKKFVSYR